MLTLSLLPEYNPPPPVTIWQGVDWAQSLSGEQKSIYLWPGVEPEHPILG